MWGDWERAPGCPWASIYTLAHSCVLVFLWDISHWLLADQYYTLLPYHILPILEASLGPQCPSESHVYGGNSTIRCSSDLGKLLCFQVLDCCAGHVHPRNPRGRATQRWGSPSAGGGHWLCICPPPPRAAPRDRSSCLLCCSTCKHNSVFSTLGPPHCRRRLPGLVMSPLNFPKIQTKESFFIPLQ